MHRPDGSFEWHPGMFSENIKNWKNQSQMAGGGGDGATLEKCFLRTWTETLNFLNF